MFTFVDSFLNKTTMYKLVLYVCLVLLGIGVIFSALHLLPFSPIALIFSTLFIIGVSWLTHQIAAWAFDAPTNIESPYITAVILALIITPPLSTGDVNYFALAAWASVWAIASKFIFAIKKKHLFNPAAFGVAITALTIGQAASWWVGTGVMLPFVLVLGWLIVRKIRRADLVWSFIAVAVAVSLGIGLMRGTPILTLLPSVLINTPIFFFAFVMLTEPLTTSPTRPSRMAYGALVGALFNPAIHIGSVFMTPEIALLIGNVLSYALSPKQKLILKLNRIETVADETFDFVFDTDHQAKFTPGQYCEWTLPHEKPDQRGNRRYFTLASSPTEKQVRMGVKFYPQPSSFKTQLRSMKPGDVIIASQISGDFILPKDDKQKLVFIAGGIGVTPFRSMVKYLVDTQQQRDITVLYCVKTPKDIAYAELFAQAAAVGVKTVYILSDAASAPKDWQGKTGFVTEALLKECVPDFAERTFYISGPHVMVVANEKTLASVGVPKTRIVTDYFPGFA